MYSSLKIVCKNTNCANNHIITASKKLLKLISTNQTYKMTKINNNHTLSLYELNQLVNQVISSSLNTDFWVEAELSEVREVRGHCYMELLEKDENLNTPIAKASAKCWSNKWLLLKPHFERITGNELRRGMKVRLRVQANFHEAYGFSWIVNDIDPTYTLGAMAQNRNIIINALKEQGVWDLQKSFTLSPFTQRIAVISSSGAAGYDDFLHHLTNNSFGFCFHIQLFNAIMQGEEVERSVIAALNTINMQFERFDLVIIIRGGGGTSDLSGFDTLALAENVANFPLPIITGIGHNRDESVLDLIAYEAVKTPTAAADYLINLLSNTLYRIENATQKIIRCVEKKLIQERQTIAHISEKLPLLFSVIKNKNTSKIDFYYQHIINKVQDRIHQESIRLHQHQQSLVFSPKQKLQQEKHHIELLQQRAKALDPKRLLEKGYSITLYNGKSVKNAKELNKGDTIKTLLNSGTITSIIK